MQQRLLPALGLAVAGLSQVSDGLLTSPGSEWALFQFAEGAGLLLAGFGVRRSGRASPGVQAAVAAVGALLGLVGGARAWRALQVGLGLGAFGGLVWLVVDAGTSVWSAALLPGVPRVRIGGVGVPRACGR